MTGILLGVAHYISPILGKYILKEKTDYIIIFLIFGSLCIIKLGILMFFPENSINEKKRKSTILSEKEF